MSFLLETCVFNFATAQAAAAAGADRLELCENYANGGTTPSYGMLKTLRESLSLPLFVMLRPRGGDYVHSQEEKKVLLQDVKLCKELGMDGVVLGLLQPDGSIDREATARLVEAAYPLDVTFHRAFDRCKNPLEALETIVDTGCTRLLTSGQKPNIVAGMDLVKTLVEQAAGRIGILPAAGLNSQNLPQILQHTGVTEAHTSARTKIPSPTQYRNPDLPEDFDLDFVNAEEIKKLKTILAAARQAMGANTAS